MSGVGEKAFCAGGDVAALAKWNTEGEEGQRRSKSYFRKEYQLDHLIATYPKPYVAIMDGITMGGGVGLSVHAPFRIATEKTMFAMPETTIGFFPDVGGSFALPRLDGHIGTYLALTSERLNGVSAYYAGIATHYIDSSSLSALTARLSELVFPDYATLKERNAIIDTTIDEYSTGLPHDEPPLLRGELRSAIDRCFKYSRIEEIIEALEKERSDWADKTLKTIRQRSPTSLKVALKQMILGRKWSIAETFQRECHIAAKFMEHPDFVEGVSARLIRKPPQTPKWQPASLAEVSDNDVDAFFNVEGDERMKLLNEGLGSDYTKYPHSGIGLPSEQEVGRYVREAGGRKDSEWIVSHFVALQRTKVGVREKVMEILDRRTRLDGEGARTWVS